jgi:hypothetical protein
MTNVEQLTDTAPALVASFALTPAIFGSKETVDDVLAAIRAEADKFIEVRDISTAAGRAAIASFAHSKIAKSKTALDELGKTVKDEAQQKVFTVDAERRRIRDFLDDLRDEVRKPLTDWEEKERQRVAAHEAKLLELRETAVFVMFEPTIEMVRTRINELAALIGRNWEEFADRAGRIGTAAGLELDKLLNDATRRENERKAREEADRLQAEREQQEREARIAREAREEAEREANLRIALAEAARREAELRHREAEEARQRMAEARERQAVEAREAAEREAEIREFDRKTAQENAIAHILSLQTMDAARPSAQFLAAIDNLKLFYQSRDWQEYFGSAAVAYDMSIASLNDKHSNAIEREHIETTRRERRIAEEARTAELKRAADELEAAVAEQDRRENNRRIRNRVRNEIAAAIAKGVKPHVSIETAPNPDQLNSDLDAIAAVVAQMLVDNEIPHVTVTF